MGYYVNLPDTKAFIDRNSDWISQREAEKFFDPSYDIYDPKKVLICAVDNYAFFAFAIAYCVEEFREFSRPSDTRPKYWYLIDKEVLINSGGVDRHTIEMLQSIGESTTVILKI